MSLAVWLRRGGNVTLPDLRMEIQFTTRIFKEGRTFMAHALELDVSSCAGSQERAIRNLKNAVRLFLEEARRMGTRELILEEVRPRFLQATH